MVKERSPLPAWQVGAWITGVILTGGYVALYCLPLGAIAIASGSFDLSRTVYSVGMAAAVALWIVALAVRPAARTPRQLWLASIPLVLTGAIALAFTVFLTPLSAAGLIA